MPAWDGNWTWDCFLAFSWEDSSGDRLIVAVNYAPNQSQCYVRLPLAGIAATEWRLEDLMGTAVYDRDGNGLDTRGLYLDAPPWEAAVFTMVARRG